MKKIFFLILASMTAQAASIDWSGTYRFEWFDITKPALGTDPNTLNSGSKSFGLHFLSLRPRVLASDGISIYSRFDLLANQDPYYGNSQIGQLWGGSGYGTTTPNNAGANNTTRDNQLNSNIAVRELFLKVEEENGALLIGRSPYQFGLGISHNAGLGLFDHWYDTKDLLAYKFFVGNVSFTPMLARSFDESPKNGKTNQEQLLEIMYDNKDAGAKLGILFERRSADVGVVADTATNTPWDTVLCNGAATCVASGAMKDERTSFFLGRQWTEFGFQVEGNFVKTKTGVVADGTQVEIDSFGIAAELKYKKPESKWGYNFNFGVASGDDSGSTKYEGFHFDRNYDVAMLLFNQRLGQRDFLKTNLIKDSSLNAATSFDDEAISNAAYLSFKVKHDWKDRWKLGYTLTYAQLMDKLTSTSNMKKDLGLELDAELVYFPREKVQWVNQIGVLMPGKAFENGTGAGGDLATGTAFGFASKAAISF